MRFSTRIQQLAASQTMAVSARAAELKAQGRDVISLAVGEPDTAAPDTVIAAAKEAAEKGMTRYTPVAGIPEARKAVAGYFKRFYAAQAAPENTILTNGGKQAIYNLFQCLINPGDEVLVPSPYWVSYPAMIDLAQGVFVPVPCGGDGKVTAQALEAARTGRTRLLVLNSPCNPTGVCYSQEELEALAEWAAAHDVFVVSDELYDQLVYDVDRRASLSPFWQKRPESVAVVGGLSKCFAVPGWRAGYALADAALIAQMAKLQGQSTSNICDLSQAAVVAALTGSFDSVVRMREIYRSRSELALSIIQGWEGVSYPVPEGAFYVFVNVSGFFDRTTPDVVSLCSWLLETVNVACVPGSAFGDPQSMRLSLCVPQARLLEALNRLGEALMGK